MTFNDLLSEYQNKHGLNHDVIFFDIVFCLSKIVKNKTDFISNRNNSLDFKYKKYQNLMNEYWIEQKPLGHITGNAKFLGINLSIGRKILCPRDVTEQMVDDFIKCHTNDINRDLLDLCCGSGCIGISIKHYMPSWKVTCVDKYWGAIINTHDNAVKNKTALTIDVCDAIKYLNKLEKIDILISNPPYISKNNFKNYQMFNWENKKALIAPENGLYFYKRYFQYLSTHKFNECWLELGYDLIDQIANELNKYKNLTYTIEKNKFYIKIFPTNSNI